MRNPLVPKWTFV